MSVLARWAGWGALAHAFDERDPAGRRIGSQLAELLSPAEVAAARRSTLNAHYTDAGIASSVWRMVSALGFVGGRVLEPGCGTGVFLATLPEQLPVEAVGIELEPITARIAALLHPDADIRNEGFESTRLLDPADLVVGNVPFAKVALHDPVHNRSRHSIHNHFLVKSVALTRPGGLVALLTSRFTLDSRTSAARRELAAHADFVGAIRLPSAAHRASAGTDVVTDLVVLRRRTEGQQAAHASSWDRSEPTEIAGGTRDVNEWFASHPEFVLGRLVAGNGVYGSNDVSVDFDGDLRPALDEALTRLAELARRGGLGYLPAPVEHRVERSQRADSAILPRNAKEGSIHRIASGFVRVTRGEPIPFEPRPRKDSAELETLCQLRDTTIELLDVQAQRLDDSAYLRVQARLNDQYDRYLRRFGPLNRFSLARTGRRDPDTGADLFRRMHPRLGGFTDDPDYRTLLALEQFDPDAQVATKAAIFTRRLLAPTRVRFGADGPDEALAVSLDETGRVDLDRIAALLDVSPTEAFDRLGDRAFRDPGTGEVMAAEQYLAGDVRQRLDVARHAAAEDAGFMANVEALERVVPADLTPAEIGARLGAPWIPADDVEVFCAHLMGDNGIVVEHAPVTAMWAVAAPTWTRRTVAATSEWGTARADAVSLIEASLNQRPATVYDVWENGSRVVNQPETVAAREKQEAIDERFAEWVWTDASRANRLADVYNRTFNATVVPRYDGAHLSLPGLTAAFAPHPHQRDAVWRVLCTGDTLLAHAVGAGKTATMVMAAMEQRRLGLVEKPAFVVPNHMLDQFTRELLQLYPAASVLVAARDDASPTGRKDLVARCATGDWNAVVLTHSTFERIPLASVTRVEFLAERMEQFRAAIAESASGKGLTVKRLEAMLARIEARHEELAAAHTKDDGATFEQTGIDFLYVDEAHAFKNKAFPTRVQGVGGSGSKRAEDLDTKLWWLRRQRETAHVACFATATPIANSIAELYVMQTYLQPAALDAAGIASFDAWAATFASTVASLELAPDGGSYRLMHRLARYRNVPELVSLAREVTDVRTTEQLDLPIPLLRGGRAETVVTAPSDALRDYVSSLVDRAQAVRDRRVAPEEDNMLKITGDGRKAALDLRLVGQDRDPDGGKIAAAADRIAAIHHANADRVFHGSSGETSARRGAMQFVFCDLGTPSTDRWNVYDHLKSLLAMRGVPGERVRFIHDATNDRAKADLFAGCRDGRVSVLIGSTEKMGVGTNAQDRAVALHHLDCPWRPADLEQREGRIRRQGNQNPEVEIIRYVTEGSFDIFMWQTVERKAGFIAQVMHGGNVAREVEDVGDQALSYAEVKALATGNPHIVEKAGVDAEVAKLTRLRAAHQRDQAALARTHASATARMQRMERDAASCLAALDRRVDTRGDRFRLSIEGARHTSRAEAGSHLVRILAAPSGEVRGSFAGLDLVASSNSRTGVATITLEPGPVNLDLDLRELSEMDPSRLVQRLEHRLGRLESDLADVSELARVAEREADAASQRLDQPFEHTERLNRLLSRQGELERLLAPVQEPPTVGDRLAAVSVAGPVRSR